LDTDRILVHDSDLLSVWVYPARRLVHHQMKTFCFGKDFRDGLTRGIEAMAQHQATKWLSDDRLNGALPPEDSDWATQEWFPRARAVGWKHWAVVQPTKIIGQVNVARFVKLYAELGIDAQLFGELDEAMRWLDGL
jgi:hypothetical protein